MTLSGDPASRKQGRPGNRALGAFRQWSFKRLRQNSWNSAKLKGSEDTAELKDIDEPESLSSEFSESDVAYPEPPKEIDPASLERRNGLLILAATIFMIGHFELILRAMLSVSLPTLSTVAAVLFLVVALWSEATERIRHRSQQLHWACQQTWDLAERLIYAILKLPDCARDIHLALQEIREVNFELKVIRSKIRFLPGQPKDANGDVIEPIPRRVSH